MMHPNLPEFDRKTEVTYLAVALGAIAAIAYSIIREWLRSEGWIQ